MNIRKMGIGALIVLAPLFNACEKAAEKGGVKATEKISIKNGKKFLSEETVALFRERYSSIDTFKVSDDMSKSVVDSVSKAVVAVKKDGGKSVRTGVNAEGKPFIVSSNRAGGRRNAIQFTEDGKYEKSTYFASKPYANVKATITKRLDSHGVEGNNYAFHENDKLKVINIGENQFAVSSGIEKIFEPAGRFIGE